jgi:DNA-binding beta-propeller fold protein YncE
VPSGYFGWIVQPYGKRVIAVNPTGEQDIIKVAEELPKPGQDRDPFAPPYKVMLLSPEEERVVEQFESNHIWAVAILAEKERSSVSWLAQGHDYWVLDAVRQVAYALRTPPQPLLFWQTLDKVDLNTRQVLHTLRMQEIGAIALSADGNRLYVPHMTDDKGATVSIYDAGTMKLLKELPASQTIERIISSRDGRMLYLVSDEAFLMMDAAKNEFIGDAFALPRMGAGAWALEVSEDGKEVYVGGGADFARGTRIYSGAGRCDRATASASVHRGGYVCVPCCSGQQVVCGVLRGHLRDRHRRLAQEREVKASRR